MRHPPEQYHAPPYERFMTALLPLADAVLRGLRRHAVHQLHLHAGTQVLDVGCGTGSNFPYLRAAVGASGRVIGIELSHLLAKRAQARIHAQRWQNVHVIVAAAQALPLTQPADGLLLFATHEILTSPAALDTLSPLLKPQACIVATGVKQSQRLPGVLLAPALRRASRHWLPNSVPIDRRPWQRLAQRIGGLQVEEQFGGLWYVAWACHELSHPTSATT